MEWHEPREIDLVIFDCDGVLVDSEHLAAEAMLDLLRAGGVRAELSHIMPGIGMKQADIVKVVEEGIGAAIDPALLADLWPATRRIFGERLKPTEGVADFLAALPAAACVASSSHHDRIRFSLAATGLDGFFGDDAVFSSTDVQRGKPAPDLVLHAARRMGADPSRCLVIEDSRFGIAGAVAAGMVPVGYVGGCHATAQSADILSAAGAVFSAASWNALALRLSPYRLVSRRNRLTPHA